MTKKKSIFSQELIVAIIVIAIYIFIRWRNASFGNYNTLLNILDISYYYVLMGIGVTFPLITGGVDLSIGTGMICYALAGGYLIRFSGMPVGLAILITVLFGVAIGTVNGTLVSIMGLPPFLATLCTCMITRGLGSVCSGSFAIPWPTETAENGWFHQIFKTTITEENGLYSGLKSTVGALFPMDKRLNMIKLPLGFIWVILILLLMQFILGHTKFGRYTIAIGSNKEATMLSGVNVKFYHVMAYVVSGLFAGLAAIAYAAYTPTVQPGTGAGMELDAIGGAIVGGVSTTGGYGTIYGTVLGVYVIMLLKNGLPFMGLNANWQQVITGTVLIVAVLIDIIKRRAMKK